MIPWTCVVLACRNSDWASAFRKELQFLHHQKLLNCEQYLVVEDPAAWVGSGGALLNALLITVERLCSIKGYTTVSADVLQDARILIVTQGRTSCYWPAGKAFFPVLSSDPNISGLQTRLERIVKLCSSLHNSGPPGVWVASTDISLSGLLSSYLDWSTVNHSGILFTVESSEQEAQFCGAVTKMDDTVQSITYNRDNSKEHRGNAMEVVSGILYFGPQLTEAMLSLHTLPPLDCATYLGVDSGESALQISLYFDLLGPLCKAVVQDDYVSGRYGATYNQNIGTSDYCSPRHMKARTLLWDLLGSFSLAAFCCSGLQQSYWIDKFPLEKILTINQLTSDADMKLPNCSHSGQLHLINSSVDVPVECDTSPALFIHSRITGTPCSTVHCKGKSYFLNINLNLQEIGNLVIEDNTVFVGHNVFVNGGQKFAVCVFSAVDVPLLVYEDEAAATFFGVSWRKYVTAKGIHEDDLWKDESSKNLYTAKLYPLLDSLSDWRNLLWLQQTEASSSIDSVRLRSWRNSTRYSMKDLIELSHPESCLLAMRQSLKSSILKGLPHWQGSFLPYFRRATAENWADEILKVLDQSAASAKDPGQVSRFLAAIADLLGSMVGDEGGLRSGPASNAQWADAFYLLEFASFDEGVEALALQRKQWTNNAERLVRAARHYERAVQIVIRNTVKSVKRLMPLEIRQSSRPAVDAWIEASCPARIDLAGGWSDTPPICYEMGGSVVNLAILVNGKRPIGSRGRRLAEPVLVLRHDQGTEPLIVTSLEQVLNYTNPLAVGALMKAALVCAGAVDPNGPSLEEQLQRSIGGGLELECWSLLPKGSGLGTSSIMAATLLAVIYSAMGVVFTRSSLIHGVLYVEQLLTTGGGWQDQVSGIIGGANRGHSPADPSVTVYVDKLHLNDDVVDKLNSHLLLLHTGKVRLARNLLQNVIRNWYARDESTVRCFKQLVENSFTCADALSQGDLSQLGGCVDSYWDQKKRLAPGCEPLLVADLMEKMKPFVYGQSLTGAGGGGFYFAITKEPHVKDLFHTVVADISGAEKLSLYEVQVDQQGITVQINSQLIEIL